MYGAGWADGPSGGRGSDAWERRPCLLPGRPFGSSPLLPFLLPRKGLLLPPLPAGLSCPLPPPPRRPVFWEGWLPAARTRPLSLGGQRRGALGSGRRPASYSTPWARGPPCPRRKSLNLALGCRAASPHNRSTTGQSQPQGKQRAGSPLRSHLAAALEPFLSPLPKPAFALGRLGAAIRSIFLFKPVKPSQRTPPYFRVSPVKEWAIKARKCFT